MRESRPQLLILALAALFHPIVETWLRPWGLGVDYPFLVVFWVAVRRGRGPGTFYGFLIGLLRDLGNFSALGGAALAYSLVGYLVGDLREKVDPENLGLRLGLLGTAYLLAQAVLLLPSTGWQPAAALWDWWRYALPGMPLQLAVYLLSLFLVFIVREGMALLNEPSERV